MRRFRRLLEPAIADPCLVMGGFNSPEDGVILARPDAWRTPTAEGVYAGAAPLGVCHARRAGIPCSHPARPRAHDSAGKNLHLGQPLVR